MEVQEVKEQLKSIFRQVINNDKWITIHPNGEDAKGKHLLLKDGESPKEAIERTYSKGEKSDTNDDGEKKKSTFKPIKGIMQSLKDDYESGKINAKEVAKELSKANLTPYLLDGNEALEKIGVKQSDTKDGEEDFEKGTKSTKKDEDRHQKVRDLEDKAYKEFKKTYDNYIYGDVKISDFDKAKEQFNKKYKEAFDKLESNRFVSFEDFAKRENKQSDTKDKESDSKGNLDIKKTTVKMKSGKEKEIEYVDSVPEGYKKLEGAMTAPLGYTWYHNGKSIIDKERKTILVKDKVNNNKEQDMTLLDELKKLITKVENNKENEEMIDNEKVDKRKLIDEVGGILKGKVDDEIIRTIIKKMEEASYNDSEASADNKKVKNEDDEEKKIDNEEEEKEEVKNKKKVKNEDEEDEEKVEELKKEEKKDVKNKCKNSKETSTFDKINAIYNSVRALKPQSTYTSRQEKLDNAVEYFKN